MLYVIIAGGVFDQVIETEKLADRVRQELEVIGYVTVVKPVKDWKEANAMKELMV